MHRGAVQRSCDSPRRAQQLQRWARRLPRTSLALRAVVMDGGSRTWSDVATTIVAMQWRENLWQKAYQSLSKLTLKHGRLESARQKGKTVNDWQQLRAAVAQGDVCLVEVLSAQGSAPREAGAWMAIHHQGWVGTIGGGHLEWEAMQRARRWLQQGLSGEACTYRLALGPGLGQCCGGAVVLRMSALTPENLAAVQQRLAPAPTPVALFGAGHVGRALVQALQPLPFTVQWVDSREDIFPVTLGPHVQPEHSVPVQDAVAMLTPHSLVLIMSFSHAEDLDIVCACLRRQRSRGDLPFVGLIGSDTKWAVFQKRLLERGFDSQEIAHITCPVGLEGVPGKEPAAIAIAVAAQLLQQREQQLSQS